MLETWLLIIFAVIFSWIGFYVGVQVQIYDPTNKLPDYKTLHASLRFIRKTKLYGKNLDEMKDQDFCLGVINEYNLVGDQDNE